MKERIREFVMKFSFQERRKAELVLYRNELSRLRNMDADELYYEYIEEKSQYEHQKMILTIFIVSIAIALLMNIWNKFFSFMEMVLQYVATIGGNHPEVTVVGFWITASVAMFFTLLILFFLFSISSRIEKTRKKVMLIKKVMLEKDCAKDNENEDVHKIFME